MKITESMIRRIIKEETKRVIKENEEVGSDDTDFTGLIERYMTDIEDLFVGGYDHEDAMDEASGMIDDLCENIKDKMHEWLRVHLMDAESDRAEYQRDAEHDRLMHAGDEDDDF